VPRVDTGEVEIFYESFGEGEPLVLIMGLGAQMVLWDETFCRRLADAGFRVIRFDNRDVGESTRLDHLGMPRLRRQLLRWTVGLSVQSAYSLVDMAGDVAGLLDALDISSAHVVGASMGGMIAQHFAIEFPSRVRSLTSIMSHPGDRLSAFPKPEALGALMKPPAKTAEQAEQRLLDFFSVVGGRAYEGDETMVRAQARRAFERGISPAGFARQFNAVIAAKDRRASLAKLRVPSLVIHGTEDPLVRPRGGFQTAKALRDSELLLIDGMGHHIPSMHWGRVIKAVAGVAERA
jgi:pimeloyl-ACP methyl ester carboxylesterase